MNELKIFENPDFGQIRTVVIDGELWFVGKDVAEILEYQNGSRDVNRHTDEEDRRGYRIGTASGEQTATTINESGLYSLILSSKMPKAKDFKHWVTSEVLPSIRKTGIYAAPEINSDMMFRLAQAMAEKEKQISALTAKNEEQRQAIEDMAPQIRYLDTILQSERTMATTQIAADYGMSARKLNQILHEEGIQHNVNSQWILYRKHMGMGYTKSHTVNIRRSDGSPDTKLTTRWTQKGRLLIHNLLEKRGIVANMDKELDQMHI